MTISRWRLRQFSPVDDQGRVVEATTTKSVADGRVVGWRVRWDAPDGRPRSRSFAKSRFPNATAALQAARTLVAALQTAADQGWGCGPDGTPVSPHATAVAMTALPTGGFADIATEWVEVNGGAAKSREQREASVNFATKVWGNTPMDDITTEDAQRLLSARRSTPGTKARRAVACGAITSDDPRAGMCSRRTEKLFLDDMRAVFRYGQERTPAACTGDPFAVLKVRPAEEAIPDPTSDVTLAMGEVLAVAAVIARRDYVLADAVLLRGIGGPRTGEMALLTVEDVDVERRVITAHGTESEIPSRLSPDGQSRVAGPLKRRQPGETRDFPYPAIPEVDAAIARLLSEAKVRHERRAEHLRDLIVRYRRETSKSHLVAKKQRELELHLSSPPRLVTMPNGSPFHVSNFSKRWWRPALAEVFAGTDKLDVVKRHLRFYSLRSAGVQWMVEDCLIGESDVAGIVGHSVETQRRHYRAVRGTAIRDDVRQRLDEGAAKLFPAPLADTE